jgi:hypothetical protein
MGSIHIDSAAFGSVTINGKKHKDVLVVEGVVVERNVSLLHRLFGTSHRISGDEETQLLRGRPDAIVIGSGQSGVLKVSKTTEQKLRNKSELYIEETPAAIKRFNQLTAAGKKVNALVHTTC